MPKFKVGDCVIATKDIEPYLKNGSINVIPKDSVGKITCVTIDKYVDYLNVIWVSDEIDKEDIPVSTDGLKEIPEGKFRDKAMVFLLGSGKCEKKR